MSIIYMNGFEWRSPYEGIMRQSVNPIVWTSTYPGYPYSGDFAAFFRIDRLRYIRSTQFANVTEFYFQFYFKYVEAGIAGPVKTRQFLRWYNNATVIGSMGIDADDQFLRVWTGDEGTLCSTGTHILWPDHWHLIELHALLDSSSGFFEMRVDGVTDSVYTGNTTPSSTSINFFEFTNYPGEAWTWTEFYLDDIIICDTDGPVNNSWPGGLRIVLLRPIAKGDYTEWIPHSDQAILDNYWCVDGYPSLTPTEYIYTMFDAKTETYVLQDLPDEAYTVAALRMDAWALKNSGSPFGLQLAVVGPGLTLSLSDPQDLAVAYNLESWLMETMPGSTTTWGVTVVNTIQGGVRSYLT